VPGQRDHRRQRDLPPEHVRGVMRIRRARAEDIEAVGEVTVAAYADFTASGADSYVQHLRDAATRDRQAELWVATPDDSDEILGTVTIAPPGWPRGWV